MAASAATRTVTLPGGEAVAALGQGTWRMGERAARRAEEIAALRHGVALGLTLVDTAEMYGEGATEELVGEALVGLRDGVFLVSKAYPENAGRASLPAACERSLTRLRTDRLDLYLLHWRGAVPLAETVDAFEAQKAKGAIREWGVSNFDLDDLRELEGLARPTLTAKAGKLRCVTNQIYYALDERGSEFSLMTYQKTLHMPAMAYCPLGQGDLASDPTLEEIAAARGATAAQIALAWVMRGGDAIAIPKASNNAHLEENFASLAITLTDDERTRLDAAHPPPTRKTPLAMV